MPERFASDVQFVRQGTCHVSATDAMILSTVLGSCVAACLHDPIARVGGMNHVLLPDDASGSERNARYGVNLMEQLINEMLKHGAIKRKIVAKVFGGANVSIGGSTIGARNGAFVKTFLAREGIACIAESLGGDRARRVRFWPRTGRASQLLLNPADVDRDIRPARVPAPPRQDEPEIWG